MILSSYNFTQNNGSFVLVFNARTGAVVLFDIVHYRLFVKQELHPSIRKQLFELGLYVKDEVDEYDEIINYCKTRVLKSHLNKYRILTTTGCNAKCPYCYEKGIAIHTMSQEIANKVADFIISRAGNNGRIQIEWFGGEPLLNTPAIDIISNRIKKDKPNGVTFTSSIVTNASLITGSLMEKFSSEWNVKRIQITVDGVGEEYEKVKGLGKDSFDHLVQVLSKLAELDISIDIRFNFDKENYHNIDSIARYFSTCSFKNKLSFYSAKIFSIDTRRGYYDLENEAIEVDSILHDYGLLTGLQLVPKVFNTGCMAIYPAFFTIDPQGKLFKCDRRLLDKNSIASVVSYSPESISVIDTNKYFIFDTRCKTCTLFPMCWGGCLYDREVGIYPCYLTERLVQEKLKLLLQDSCSTYTNGITVLSSGKRCLSARLNMVSYNCTTDGQQPVKFLMQRV